MDSIILSFLDQNRIVGRLENVFFRGGCLSISMVKQNGQIYSQVVMFINVLEIHIDYMWVSKLFFLKFISNPLKSVCVGGGV